jgi:hypothetical protein
MNSEEEEITILREESTNVSSFADFGGSGWETSVEQPSKIAATETPSGWGMSTDRFSNSATIETGFGWGRSGGSTAVQTSNDAVTVDRSGWGPETYSGWGAPAERTSYGAATATATESGWGGSGSSTASQTSNSAVTIATSGWGTESARGWGTSTERASNGAATAIVAGRENAMVNNGFGRTSSG